jgi:hypothetical protein
MNRKEFLTSMAALGAGSCLCGAVSGLCVTSGPEASASASDSASVERAVQRMKFADNWVRRFMDVLDNTLDEPTRRKVMMTNGQTCFREWIAETGQKVKPQTLDELREWAEVNVTDGSMRIDGNVIHYTFTVAAETGQPAPEGHCLCPMVESKPAGLSSTYCMCSLGYVQEWYEQKLQKPVTVELVESVLRGGKHCTFKITVA